MKVVCSSGRLARELGYDRVWSGPTENDLILKLGVGCAKAVGTGARRENTTNRPEAGISILAPLLKASIHPTILIPVKSEGRVPDHGPAHSRPVTGSPLAAK